MNSKRLCLLALLLAVPAYGVWWGLRHRSAADSGTGGGPEARDEKAFFQDVTAGSGLDFTFRNGEEADQYSILESIGGGVALLDFDGDGLLDVFVTGGGTFEGPDKRQITGRPCRLYKNLGGWKFRDVTPEAGLTDIPFYSHGCAVADYDRDGWPDLLVTGYGRLALFRNVPDGRGGRRFAEVTREAGLLGKHFWGTSAAWADLDGDGYPDLYVCQYVDWSWKNNPVCEGYDKSVKRDVCPPRQFEARPHALYRNNGGKTFTDVTKEAGLHTERTGDDYERLTFLDADQKSSLREADRDREFGKGLGVVIADLEGDGRPDLYVANDTTDKFLYMNESRRGELRFVDRALQLGVARDDRATPNGSMGVDVADYDGSGRPSLWVTNYQNEYPALYQNVSTQQKLMFQFASRSAGLEALGQRHVSFGTGFIDIDNDGWEGIVIVNGHVVRHPTGSRVRQLPLLLRNGGGGAGQGPVRFTEVGARAGEYFRQAHQGRGLAIGDLDNDGRADLIVSHINAPVTILRNVADRDNHWLGVALADKENRDLVGAKLTLEVGGRSLTRFAKGGGSYLSSGDRRHLFGLGGEAKVGRLRVTWPWGRIDTWEGLGVDRYWRVTAGEATARQLEAAK